jgi:hypothetical protein
MRCTLNVTDREYDKILQLTHDAIEWTNTDPHILEGVGDLLGRNVAVDLRDYDEIRMEKHDSVSGLPRVEPRRNGKMNESKKRDPRAADIPAQNPPPITPGKDEPFPRGSTIEETNSDRDIEEKQTVSGD